MRREGKAGCVCGGVGGRQGEVSGKRKGKADKGKKRVGIRGREGKGRGRGDKGYATEFVVEVGVLDGAALLFPIDLNLEVIVCHHVPRLSQLHDL